MMICYMNERRNWYMPKKGNIKKEILNYAVKLRLSTLKTRYEDLAKKASQESLSYEEYLLALLEEEYSNRRNNRVKRLLQESKIPLEKRLSTFDLKRLPGKLMQQVKILLQGSFVDHQENILAFGNPGSGKTHLLCAIGQELIQQGKRVYFSRCSNLVQELLRAKKNLELPKILKKLEKYEVIIIDDLGYVQQNREEMEVLFTLLAEKYERGSLMLTSNLPFSKWEKIFKDPMVTAAAIDRLVHHSVILELNLPSYRMEKAKKNKN